MTDSEVIDAYHRTVCEYDVQTMLAALPIEQRMDKQRCTHTRDDKDFCSGTFDSDHWLP